MKLYGVTNSSCRLVAWNDLNAWIKVAGLDLYNRTVRGVVVYNDKVYSLVFINDSPDAQFCKLYEYNGTDAWVEVASYYKAYPYCMIVYNNKLYCSVRYLTDQTYGLLEWGGSGNFVQVASLPEYPYAPGKGISVLVVYNDQLYGTTEIFGYLYKWNNLDAWIFTDIWYPDATGTEGIMSLIVYNGLLYGGLSDFGKLLKCDGVHNWVEVAPMLGDERSIRCLIIYNGELYAGTSPNAKFYKWNGINAWIQVTDRLTYQSAIDDFIIYNDRLYCTAGAMLYEWNGTDAWVMKTVFGDPAIYFTDQYIQSLVIYHDFIITTTVDFDSTPFEIVISSAQMQPDLFTGDIAVEIPDDYTINGQVYIYSDVPMPITILSIVLEGNIRG